MPTPGAAYQSTAPDQAAVQGMRGFVLLDFGTEWCGHCVAARPAVNAWIHAHEGANHLRMRMAPAGRWGAPIASSCGPTLVLLRDGQEVVRVVRPREARDMWPLDEALG